MEKKIIPVTEKAGLTLDSARALVDEARPKIHDLLARVDEITVSARDQVARLDAFVTEATESARGNLQRIDLVVNDTVEKVQETTTAVQTTILRPVREVNGVVSGFRAALSVLARGNRASSGSTRLKMREMFI